MIDLQELRRRYDRYDKAHIAMHYLAGREVADEFIAAEDDMHPAEIDFGALLACAEAVARGDLAAARKALGLSERAPMRIAGFVENSKESKP